MPTARELKKRGEFLGCAFVTVAFGDGEEKAEAFGGGVEGDGVGIVGVDPAVFGEEDDFPGKGRREDAGVAVCGREEKFGLIVIELAGGRGPSGGFLGSRSAFFFENGMPFGIESGGFGGDGKSQ